MKLNNLGDYQDMPEKIIPSFDYLVFNPIIHTAEDKKRIDARKRYVKKSNRIKPPGRIAVRNNVRKLEAEIVSLNELSITNDYYL